MKPSGHRDLNRFAQALPGLRCWYVSCGGCTLPTFQLACGKKIRRDVPVKNPKHSKDYRNFEGEANLLVWCTWRLDGPERALTSSDDRGESIVKEMGRLVGATVEAVSLTPPSWDLAIEFTKGLTLRVFCDHVPGDPSFDGNWSIWLPTEYAAVGPGLRYEIEAREDAVANGTKPARGRVKSRT